MDKLKFLINFNNIIESSIKKIKNIGDVKNMKIVNKIQLIEEAKKKNRNTSS